MTSCKSCGAHVAKSAAKCPQCGAAKGTAARWVVIATGGLVLLLLTHVMVFRPIMEKMGDMDGIERDIRSQQPRDTPPTKEEEERRLVEERDRYLRELEE